MQKFFNRCTPTYKVFLLFPELLEYSSKNVAKCQSIWSNLNISDAFDVEFFQSEIKGSWFQLSEGGCPDFQALFVHEALFLPAKVFGMFIQISVYVGVYF